MRLVWLAGEKKQQSECNSLLSSCINILHEELPPSLTINAKFMHLRAGIYTSVDRCDRLLNLSSILIRLWMLIAKPRSATVEYRRFEIHNSFFPLFFFCLLSVIRTMRAWQRNISKSTSRQLTVSGQLYNETVFCMENLDGTWTRKTYVLHIESRLRHHVHLQK